MPHDYLAEFPIPLAAIPQALRELLSPVGIDGETMVEVCTNRETEAAGERDEYVQMHMAVVPEEDVDGLAVLSEASDGVVSFSVPCLGKKGDSREFSPSVSSYDYVVASWGSNSFYTYNLAEKVWMSLGLTPRCLGNEAQRLVYDDLSVPVFGVAHGEVSAEYYWKASRPVTWKMSNEYLRKYLWMRGAVGVRCFFYKTELPDRPEMRALMNGAAHITLGSATDWFELNIREHEGALLLQVWATVAAVSCELSPELSCDGLSWPGVAEPVTSESANAMVSGPLIYLDDQFLERYEQSDFYETVPGHLYEQWSCSPSYRGQWSFSDCVRVGRNLVQVPLRELYKPKPDREIVHAHLHVVAPELVAQLNHDEEHIVSKTARLLEQILNLGDNLAALGEKVGIDHAPEKWVGFSRATLAYSGWAPYPQLKRLAQVAPLAMSQQAFLARCKGLHELWQRVPDGYLRKLLEAAGCPKGEIQSIKSLKLLQSLLNILLQLDAQQEQAEAFKSAEAREGWSERNSQLAPLFLNNDLRIADAHEAVGRCMQALQGMGFDTASLNQGYGRALDFVFDGVIGAFESVNAPLRSLLSR